MYMVLIISVSESGKLIYHDLVQDTWLVTIVITSFFHFLLGTSWEMQWVWREYQVCFLVLYEYQPRALTYGF